MDQNSISAKKTGRATRMFASFRLGKTELGLDVATLQEVVRFPERVNQVPLAPPFLLGLFNLRGLVIPVVDVAKLLGFETAPVAVDDRRVAILIVGHVRIGLAFDATSEILTVPEEDIMGVNEGRKASPRSTVIRSVLRLENGERLVEIIDPMMLLTIENLPQILERTNDAAAAVQTRKVSKREQCISFRSGKLEFGLRIGGISEIIRVPEVKDSVLAGDQCLGMFTLRGAVVPLIDFAQFFKVEPATEAVDPEKKRVVVLKLEKMLVGFLVDGVDNIVTFFADDVLPIPMFAQAKVDMMRGMLPQPTGEGLILLREDRILSDDDIQGLSRGHRDLYSQTGGSALDQRSKALVRKPYLAFRLKHRLSAKLGAIDEIATPPTEDIMRPPGYPTYVVGVMNLRGEVVTVVDLRSYYGLPAEALDAAESKVLIVKGSKAKFGLLVDAVDAISHVDESQKLRIPQLMLPDVGEKLLGDTQEVVEMPSPTGERKTFMVLDIPEVLRKLESKIAG